MNVFHETQVPWPKGKPRTKDGEHKTGGFRSGHTPISLSEAAERVREQVSKFTKPGKDWRTTELWIYVDGAKLGNRRMFLANQPRNLPPGVLVSFDLDGDSYSIAGDRLSDPAQNLAAIAKFIESQRDQERYGLFEMSELFQAFAALPGFDWQGLLDHPKDLADAESVYRAKARSAHPDSGGSHEAMADLNRAITEAREVLK